MRRPRALPPGGVIGIVAPSTSPDPVSLQIGRDTLAARGFYTVLAPHVLDRYGHMAGLDADRAQDFMDFYADPAIDVLWCARGGYSSCRLWPLIDWERLAFLPPKMVVGYSDATSLLVPLTQRVGTVALHGPMVFELGQKTTSVALDWTLRLLQTPAPLGALPESGPETLVPGIVEGVLCGGCLSLLAAAVGTAYCVDARNKLLLLEDIHETPPRMERSLVQLREAGILASAAGFIVGQVTDADETGSLPMRQLWEDFLGSFGKPTVLGFPFGHVPNNYALPLGVRARLDANTGLLTLLEAAVEG